MLDSALQQFILVIGMATYGWQGVVRWGLAGLRINKGWQFATPYLHCLLADQDSLEEGVRNCHISCPANKTNHGVLIDRKTIRIQRYHVTPCMGSPVYVLCVEKVHSRRRPATYGCTS